MGLKQQAASLTHAPGLPCGVARMVEDVAACDTPHEDRWPDEAAEFMDAVDDLAVGAVGLSRAMTQRGHPISTWVIGHHRRGDCRCP